METKQEPWLARYASSAGVVLVPVCLAPLFLLPYTGSGQALALLGISTALMSLIAAWFRLAGHAPHRKHLDLIGKQVTVAAATLGLWTAVIGYAFFTELAAAHP